MLGGFNPFDLGGLAAGGKNASAAKKSVISKPKKAEKQAPEEVAEETQETPKEDTTKKEKEVKPAKTKSVKPSKPSKTPQKVVKPAKSAKNSKEDAEKEYQRKMRLAFEAQFGQVEGINEEEEEDEEDEESESDSNNEDFDDNEDLVELSKTYVEQPSSDEDMDSDSEAEMEAKSEEKKEEGPIVVRFTGSDRSTRDFNEKAEKKRFMSRKTPLSEVQKEEKEKLLAETQRRPPKTKEEEEEEKEDLQNDVALQRLINESSILHSQAAQSSFSGADISFLDDGPIGKARLKTLTSRIESLGGKHIPLQKNMPMLTRKMVNSKFQKKVKAEQEHAQEAGIILAKTAPVDNRFAIRKKKVVKRDRGLKINSVGKSTAGGIKLSKHEIRKFGGKI